MTTDPRSASALLAQAAKELESRAEIRDQADGERSMARAVAAFNSLENTALTELQGWRFLATLKLARSTGGQAHADDYIDLAGYAALAGECALADTPTTQQVMLPTDYQPWCDYYGLDPEASRSREEYLRYCAELADYTTERGP